MTTDSAKHARLLRRDAEDCDVLSKEATTASLREYYIGRRDADLAAASAIEREALRATSCKCPVEGCYVDGPHSHDTSTLDPTFKQRPTMGECAIAISNLYFAPTAEERDNCEAILLDICRRLGAQERP